MLGTIVVCTTYQASSGILPLTCLAMGLGMWCRKVDRTQVRSFLLSAAGGYVVGMLLFRFILMTNPYEYGDYVDTSLDLLAIVPNLKNYVILILNGFPTPWLLLLVVITCSYFLVMLYNSRHNKLLTLLLTVMTAACLFVLSLGVNIALRSPLFEPRALYGLGIAVAIFCIEIALAEKQIVSKAAVLLLSLSFVSFSFIYGNALHIQKNYTELRMTQLVSDLTELDMLQKDANIKIQVKGSVGYADQLTRSLITYPLLREMIPIQLQDSDWYWGDYELLYHTGLNGMIQKEWELDLSTIGLPILKDTAFHTISGNQDYILIELKE